MKKKVFVIGLGLSILGLVVFGLFQLPHWAILTWAILATVTLPIVAWGAWALGRYEAQAVLQGIDKGIDKVALAMSRVQPRRTTTQVAVLPQLPVPQVQHLEEPTGKVVDL